MGAARARIGLIIGLLATSVGLAAASPLPAEGESMLALLEWEHPFPAEVSYYRIHFSDSAPEDGTETTALEVGLPGAQGRYSWSLTVQPQKRVWVAVEAVGPTGLKSALSEWRLYAWKPGGGELGPRGTTKSSGMSQRTASVSVFQ